MMRIVLVAVIFCLSFSAFGQTYAVGDKRTRTGTTTWATPSNWETCSVGGNPGTWVTGSVAGDVPTGTAGVTIYITRSISTSTSAFTLAGSMVISSGATLTITNSAANPDFTVSNTGILTNSSGATITLTTGGTALSIAGILNNAGTLNTNSTNAISTTVTGTINNTGTINSLATKLIFSSGSLYDHQFNSNQAIPAATWNTGSTCQISGNIGNTSPPSGGLSPTGGFSNFTWNCAAQTSTINLGGALTQVNGDLTISSTGTGVVYVMSQAGQSNLTVGGNFVVSGTSQVNLTQDGTSSVLSVTGNFTKSSSSAFNAATGSGSVNITVGGVFSTTGTFNASTSNLTIGASSTLAGTISTNDLMISDGVTINNNGSVAVNGTLTLGGTSAVFNANGSGSGTLTLISKGDKPALDASIAALPDPNNFTGNVTVQRYMAAISGVRPYRYLSSPITNAKVSDWQDDFAITGNFSGASTTDNGLTTVCGIPIVSTNTSMYYYDPVTTQDYVDYPLNGDGGVNAPLDPKKGFVAQIRNCSTAVVIDVTGPINKGDQTFTLTYHSGDTYTPSLVGNPYPSAIDWGMVNLAAPTSANVSTFIAIPDNSNNNNVAYVEWDNSNGPGSYVATGQAFWAFTMAGTDNQFTLTEDAKASYGSASFYRTATTAKDKLTLTVSNGSFTDKAVVRLHDRAKASFERYDGPKLDNAFFNISTLSSNSVNLAVNSMNSISCGTVIQINSKDLSAGNYTFAIAPEGQLAMYDYTLKDAYKGTNTLLSASQPFIFSVDANAASKSVSRFQLVVSEKKYSLKLGVTPEVKICGTDASITVSSAEKSIQYVAQLAGVTVTDTLSGDGGNLAFKIPAAKLNSGNNTIAIRAIGGCSVSTLEQTSVVNKDDKKYNAVQLSSANACPGVVTISVSGAPDGGSYNWYNSNADDAAPIVGQNTASYKPTLQVGAVTYYVAVVSNTGCIGPKNAVATKVTATFNPTDLASSIACNKGTVTLTANGAPPDGRYNWYGSNDTTPIAGQNAATFVTPTLQTTTTYYASIVNSAGCEGAKIAVSAKVFNYQEAAILRVDDTTLKSNYPYGNQWFLNEVALDTTAVLKISAAGLYTLKVKIGECISSIDQRVDVVMGLEDSFSSLTGYPNPVNSIYTLQMPSEGISSDKFMIYNSIGGHIGTMSVSNNNNLVKGEYDFSSHNPGLYFIRVQKGKNSLNVKVIKK